MAKQQVQECSNAVYWNNIIISLVVFVVLALLVLYMPNMREIDANILHSIRLALSPYPSSFASNVATFGYPNHMLWPQIAAGSVLVSHRKYVKAFLLVFLTQATFIIVDLAKNYICRQRPCIYPGYSFPSSHAAGEMCFYGIVIYLILHYCKIDFWRYFLAILFGVFIALVAISRLWLGVHFLSDVVAGLALGFLMVNLYIILARFFSR